MKTQNYTFHSPDALCAIERGDFSFYNELCQVVKLQKIMFFYVYVLESKQNNEFYLGSTKNLVRRIKEHNLGRNFATKPHQPWQLIYYEANLNEKDAKRREDYLKTN